MKTKLTLLALSVVLSSCAFKINADGSKDATVDAKTAFKMIQVLSEK
jgi:hypothetical protein